MVTADKFQSTSAVKSLKIKTIMGKNDRCCVYKCAHDRDEGATCSFYRIPREPKDLVAKYQALLKYDIVTSGGKKMPWFPTVNSKICSCHWPAGCSPGTLKLWLP